MSVQIRTRTPASTDDVPPDADAAPKRFQPAPPILMRIARRTSVAQTADRNRAERRTA